MILLDTNLLIYASDTKTQFYSWAIQIIAEAVSDKGAAINAVCLAEVCVGAENPKTVADRIRSWGVDILDIPACAAEVCAKAYREYRDRRRKQSGKDSLVMPLPDFFIGAHAQVMRWSLATADEDRIKAYFPSVRLITP